MVILLSGCVGWSSAFCQVRGVLIDPGHGGTPKDACRKVREGRLTLWAEDRRVLDERCTGSQGPDGTFEKTVTLAVAQRLASALNEQGIPSALTRDSDRFLSLDERIYLVNDPKYKGWVLVSLHFDQWRPGKKNRRTPPRECAVYVNSRGSALASRSVYPKVNQTWKENHALARCLAEELRTLPNLPFRGIREEGIAELSGSVLPGVLIEGGFLSHPEEGRWMASREFQDEFSGALSRGLGHFCRSNRGPVNFKETFEDLPGVGGGTRNTRRKS